MIGKIKIHLKRYYLNSIAKDIKRLFLNSRKETDKYKVVSLTPSGKSRGNALLSYIIDGFLLDHKKALPTTHTNIWASYEIARIFMDLGFCVDVISYKNCCFLPKKPYSLMLDVRNNLERLSPFLNAQCIKIMHLDTKNILFHNIAENMRLLNLQKRKGVTLKPRRVENPNRGLEFADCGITTGDRFTQESFQYAGKPIYSVAIPASANMPWPENKNFDECRNHFLWFSSGGLVFKGLDLVLEAFTEMPDYHLTVCCRVQDEKDFKKLYHKELYQTKNIHTIGWVDVNGEKFYKIVNSCVATILPSCSEGASVSTINCMHAGLIPIVSSQSGIDTKDFGFVLKEATIAEIKECVQRIAKMNSRELFLLARKSWEYAHYNHTREKFSETYRKAIEEIISRYHTFSPKIR